MAAEPTKEQLHALALTGDSAPEPPHKRRRRWVIFLSVFFLALLLTPFGLLAWRQVAINRARADLAEARAEARQLMAEQEPLETYWLRRFTGTNAADTLMECLKQNPALVEFDYPDNVRELGQSILAGMPSNAATPSADDLKRWLDSTDACAKTIERFMAFDAICLDPTPYNSTTFEVGGFISKLLPRVALLQYLGRKADAERELTLALRFARLFRYPATGDDLWWLSTSFTHECWQLAQAMLQQDALSQAAVTTLSNVEDDFSLVPLRAAEGHLVWLLTQVDLGKVDSKSNLLSDLEKAPDNIEDKATWGLLRPARRVEYDTRSLRNATAVLRALRAGDDWKNIDQWHLVDNNDDLPGHVRRTDENWRWDMDWPAALRIAAFCPRYVSLVKFELKLRLLEWNNGPLSQHQAEVAELAKTCPYADVRWDGKDCVISMRFDALAALLYKDPKDPESDFLQDCPPMRFSAPR